MTRSRGDAEKHAENTFVGTAPGVPRPLSPLPPRSFRFWPPTPVEAAPPIPKIFSPRLRVKSISSLSNTPRDRPGFLPQVTWAGTWANRQLSFFGGLLNRWAGQFPVTFIDQWHGLLEPRDPGAVPSPVGRLEARDRWRNGWDATGAVVPRRRKGPAFGTGIGGAARLAPSVM